MDLAAIKESWSTISAKMPSSEEINTAWVESLHESGTPEEIKAGGTVISVLDQDTDIGYLLLSGDYKVQKEGEMELEKSAPELLGEMAGLNPSRRRTANIRAVSDISMIKFSWDKLNAKLQERLSESDYTKLKDSLKQYAWEHFME